MQKVMLTQNDVENTFKTQVQYEIPTPTPAQATPTTAPQEITEIKKPKITPLHIIIGALILL